MTRPVDTAARQEAWDAVEVTERTALRTALARKLIGNYAAGVDGRVMLAVRLAQWAVLKTVDMDELTAALAPVDAAVAAVREDCDWCHHGRLCGRCSRNQDAVHDAVVAAADAIVGGVG